MVDPQQLTIQKAIKKAKKAIKQGNISAAKQLYSAVLQTQPSNPVAKKGLRKLVKNLPRKQSVQTQLTNPSQDQINALTNLYYSGQFTKAEQVCKELLQTFPQSLIVINVLGAALKGQGKLQEAVQAFDKAIQLKPDFEVTYNNRGTALKELGQLEEAVKSYDNAIQLKPEYAEAHYNRSNALKDLEQLKEAVDSYNKAIQIKPDYAEAYYNRGVALRDLGQLEEAIGSYQQSLDLNPSDPSSLHMINSMTGGDSIIAPRGYVENLFNYYAPNFENSLVNKLEYKIPSLLKKTLVDLGFVIKFDKAIDLGCGTGLAGIEFRNIVDTLIGIDLSENMILKAEEKNIYDELYVDDLISGINKTQTNFDLFISTDVLVYLGDLHPLFRTIEKHANNNALFIFSTEDVDDDSYCLRSTGRFAHSKEYVLSVAADCGFEVEFFDRSNLRKDKAEWIIGGIYILKKV